MTCTHNSKSYDSFTNDITYYSPTDLNQLIRSTKETKHEYHHTIGTKFQQITLNQY